MNPIEEYNRAGQGTLMGEIRHEIFQKHGLEAYQTAHYYWSKVDIDESNFKVYTLVNSNPTQFLIATVTCAMMDARTIDPETKEKIDVPPVFVRDELNPTHLHLEWAVANIPFATRDILDAQGISYTLP